MKDYNLLAVLGNIRMKLSMIFFSDNHSMPNTKKEDLTKLN